jgi:single-stranded-DNA-specific exonuclease
MKFEILNTELDLPLIDRLLKIRNIDLEKKDDFLNPSWKNFWYDPFLLSDMWKAVNRILKAIENNERIVVFGDYDVDGVTATYVVFYFIYKFLNYKNISIRLPSRQDGYGIRGFHLDELKEKNVSLVITVDNGITAVEEAEYAKKIWLDLIITDHHTPLDQIPSCLALVNPKTSPNYPFKEIAGVGVAFKLISAIANKLKLDSKLKEKIINYFLPIVSIWTVADCVPLVDENRLLVKKWLEIINNKNKRPPNIQNMIDFLNLKNVDSYHIGFVIWPRLNASWRIYKPDDSFQVLFQHNQEVQTKYLEKLDKLNKQRQDTQSDILSEVEKNIDLSKNILVSYWDFHEWVIGIVSWRLTEKYNKPSIIMHIDKEKNIAVGSCRAPMYFSIVKMLNDIWKDGLLERFGGHAQAGWLTIKCDNIDKFIQAVYKYWKNILPQELEKIVFVDTEITEKDLLSDDINHIWKLAPFGEQNPQPTFLIKDLEIKKIDFVWKQKNHLKILVQKWDVQLTLIRWSWKSMLEKIWEKKVFSIVWNYEKDDYNWWYYFKIKEII